MMPKSPAPYAVSVLALAVLFIHLPAGFHLSWVDFTFGGRALDSGFGAGAALFLAGHLGAGLMIEAVFRRGLLRTLVSRWGTARGFALHLLAVNVVWAAIWFRWGAEFEELGLGRLVVYENGLQVCWALMFLRTGSWMWTGCLHGLFNGVRFVVINDVVGPVNTLYFYASSHPAFYWLMVATPFLACAVMALSRSGKRGASA